MPEMKPQGMQPGVAPPAHVPADEHGGRGHEPDDVSIPAIVKFVGALTFGAVVVFFVLRGLWGVFVSSEESDVTRNAPFSNAQDAPPTPRLQVTPDVDLTVYLEKERQRLGTYGRVSEGSEQVHIPIDRAMDMVAQQGLPSRAAQQPANTPPRQQVLKGNGGNPNEPKAQ